MLSTHKKTLQIIRETDNHYLAALKGNQASLHQKIVESFRPRASYFEVNKGHGRVEKRLIETMPVKCQDYPDWTDINTVIRVT